MNLVTVSGPPSSGKTAVILKTIDSLQKRGLEVGVVKFDCLYTDDDILYEKAGVKVKKGLSGSLCPDHYFVSYCYLTGVEPDKRSPEAREVAGNLTPTTN